MKNTLHLFAYSALFLMLPVVTFAAAGGFAGGEAGDNDLGIFLSNVTSFIGAVLVPLVLALAFLAFVWGVFKFFIAGGADEEKRNEGKQLMIYAILGFVLIVALYGIIGFVVNTLGFSTTVGIDIPELPGVAAPATSGPGPQ